MVQTTGAGVAGGVTLAAIQGEFDARFGQEDVNILSDYPTTQPISSAVADTFGSWVEIVADVGATPIVILAVIVARMTGLAGTGTDAEIEIGTGAAAAETRALGVVYGVIDTNEFNPEVFTVLRRIPASARLSCRARSTAAVAQTFRVTILYRIGA